MKSFIFAFLVVISISNWGESVQNNGIEYDANKNLQIYSGKVLKVNRLQRPRNDGYAIHMVMELKDRTRKAFSLAPDWYLQDINLTLEPDDELVVKGQSFRVGTEEMVFVFSIEKDQKKYAFRDVDGSPFWTGRRMKL